MSENTSQEPTVITLDNKNSIQILTQYVEVAQQKGAYLLNEAEILKRAMDVSVNNVPDNEIDTNLAKQLLIQGVNKGQRHGAYTLNDASLLSKVVAFVASGIQGQEPAAPAAPEAVKSVVQDQAPVAALSDDLSDLAEPIPLKPKEV
jgi:hypothetical protein